MSSKDLRGHTRAVATSRRTRRWGIGIVAAIALFGLLGFFAVPPLARHMAERQLTELLARPVTIGKLSLNPYTLRLEAQQIHIGEAGGQGDFVDVAKLVLDASWGSLFRLKPVVNEVYLDAPKFKLVRTAPNRFNFSDLVDKFSKPGDPAAKPALFSVSNIHVDNGRVDFDDRVLNEQHTVDQWQFGIPFIANLPSATTIFVQPFMQARIDGSPISITGKTKPFADSRESEAAFKLNALDLEQLMPYVPATVPVAIAKGHLSTDLIIRFSVTDQQPSLQIGGTVDIADLAITDRSKNALFDTAAIHVAASALEPLRGVFHLDEVRIQQPRLNVARDQHGVINLAALSSAPAQQAPAAAPAPAAAAPAPLPDVAIKQFILSDGGVRFRDQQTGADLGIDGVALKLDDVSTLAQTPTRYTLQAHLAQGGDVSSQGTFAVPGKTLEADVTVNQFSLPAIQPFLTQVLAAQLAQGTLDVKGSIKADASGAAPSVQVGPAEIGLNDLRIMSNAPAATAPATRGRKAAPAPAPVIALAKASVQIQQIDTAARTAQLTSIDVKGLKLDAARDKDGTINLAALLKQPAAAPAKAPATSAKVAPATSAKTQPDTPWKYRIAQASLSDAAITFSDATTPRRVSLSLSPLQLKVGDITDDRSKPWKVDFSTGYQRNGKLSVAGTATLEPMRLALRVDGRNLDAAALEPYIASRLNASIASALINVRGDLGVTTGKSMTVTYRGDAGLGDVRMLDKATSDPFAGWKTFSVSRIKARYDEHDGVDVDAGRIALDDFYARIFLDANGRLNLSSFSAQKDAPNQSLTRADDAPTTPTPAKAPAPAEPAATDAAAPADAGPPMRLHFGEIALSHGKVDYTDNFIKPNFSADLIEIQGKIGAFGTQSTEPAAVDVSATLNANGPVAIKGTVNPLVKPPALDMTATTRDVELTNFTAYSTKYAGYPIVKGKLNVDLHYQLDQDHLTANNHLFIDQLTFGDRVENDTATHLPVQLAIALLKNSRGEIDVNVPVSGSLSDPQFSVGSLIWHAVLNLLTRAVTSPFNLLASAFGGSDEELGYVEFAPGSAVLADADKEKLDKLGKALSDRPALKLDLIGRVDPALDGPALKAASVERQIKQQKIKDVVGKGESVDPDSISITPEEHDKYLSRAYSAASFKKPRNMIGLSKSLPPEEMTKLMLDNASTTDADLQALARQRSMAVQQWFQGKIPSNRVFVVAPKLDASDIKDKGKTTRVEFALK